MLMVMVIFATSMTSQANKLSEFIFHKANASHLEVDGLDHVTLKFRKATFEDRESMKVKYENGDLKHIFPEGGNLDDKAIFGMVDLVYEFLSKESKKDLAKIKLHDIDEDGKTFEVKKKLKEKYKMIFISTLDATQDIYKIFLEIHGLDTSKVDQIEKMVKEVGKVKKKNKPVRMRR